MYWVLLPVSLLDSVPHLFENVAEPEAMVISDAAEVDDYVGSCVFEVKLMLLLIAAYLLLHLELSVR
jgi:hypothetical protein